MPRFTPMDRPSPHRNLAAALWRAPTDPTLLGVIDVEFSAAADFLARYNELFRARVTPTHLTGRAVALLLAKYPETNAVIDLTRIRLRESADIFYLIASERGRNLTGQKIEAADRRSMAEMSNTMRDTVRSIRRGQDPNFSISHANLRRSPLWLVRMIVPVVDFVNNWLRLDLPALGAPRDPYGGAMITSLGSFGFETGFAALVPRSRTGFVVAIMELRRKPWVIEDRVEPRPVLRLCCTTDHRIIDGHSGGVLLAELKILLSEPERLLTEEEAEIWQADRVDTAPANLSETLPGADPSR